MAAIVDAHTHFFSAPFFETLARLSPHAGDTQEKLSRVAAAAGLDLPSTDVHEHLARWLSEFDRHGVAHAVTFASLPEEIPAVAEAIAAAPDRLTGFGLVNPKAENAVDAVRRMFETHGYRGILLFPAMHHFQPADPEARAVFEVVEGFGGVAVVHCGMLQVKLRDLLGLPRPYDLRYANPLDLVPAANRHRGMSFVIPHFGAGMLRECLMAGAQCQNVLVDTSSSNAWMTTQPAPLQLGYVFRRALDVFGPSRILFGTDSSTFPRGWRDDLHRAQQAALDECGVSDAEREQIFGGNARRILALDALLGAPGPASASA